MQINSVSNGLNFGALSPELHENMWQAVKRNCPKGCQNINKLKLYQDYKKILDFTKGDECMFVELGDSRFPDRRIIAKTHPKGREKRFEDFQGYVFCDVTEACYAEDKYKEMIKIFAKWIKS